MFIIYQLLLNIFLITLKSPQMSSEENIITPILQKRKLKCKMLHCSRSRRQYVPEQKFPKQACWPHTLLSTNTTLAWLKSHGMSKYGISSLKMKLKKECNELTWYQSTISTLIPFLENQNPIQPSSVFFPLSCSPVFQRPHPNTLPVP